MTAFPVSAFTATLVVAIFIGRLEGLKSAPVPTPFLPLDHHHHHKMSPREIKSDKFIDVVFLSCSQQGQHALSIERGKHDCINVNLARGDTVISTNPEGMKLHIYAKSDCVGDPILYQPSSSQNIPFQVASFMIQREHS